MKKIKIKSNKGFLLVLPLMLMVACGETNGETNPKSTQTGTEKTKTTVQSTQQKLTSSQNRNRNLMNTNKKMRKAMTQMKVVQEDFKCSDLKGTDAGCTGRCTQDSKDSKKCKNAVITGTCQGLTGEACSLDKGCFLDKRSSEGPGKKYKDVCVNAKKNVCVPKSRNALETICAGLAVAGELACDGHAFGTHQLCSFTPGTPATAAVAHKCELGPIAKRDFCKSIYVENNANRKCSSFGIAAGVKQSRLCALIGGQTYATGGTGKCTNIAGTDPCTRVFNKFTPVNRNQANCHAIKTQLDVTAMGPDGAGAPAAYDTAMFGAAAGSLLSKKAIEAYGSVCQYTAAVAAVPAGPDSCNINNTVALPKDLCGKLSEADCKQAEAKGLCELQAVKF